MFNLVQSAFETRMSVCMRVFSHVQLFAAPWTIACQAPLYMEFSRKEYWSRLPFPIPEETRGNHKSCWSVHKYSAWTELDRTGQLKRENVEAIFTIYGLTALSSTQWHSVEIHIFQKLPRFLVTDSCWNLTKILKNPLKIYFHFANLNVKLQGKTTYFKIMFFSNSK